MTDKIDIAAPKAPKAVDGKGCHAKGEMAQAARKAGKSETLDRFAKDYPLGPHDQPQSMCPAFGSLRVGLRMRRTGTILSGSACCVYGLTFTSHFYGARRTVGYVPFNSETLVTGKLFEDIKEAVEDLADHQFAAREVGREHLGGGAEPSLLDGGAHDVGDVGADRAAHLFHRIRQRQAKHGLAVDVGDEVAGLDAGGEHHLELAPLGGVERQQIDTVGGGIAERVAGGHPSAESGTVAQRLLLLLDDLFLIIRTIP